MVDVIAVLMLVTGAMTFLYPWTPSQPLASKLIHLPLALIPLWITYEVLMPDHMNIRVDLFFIPPFLLLVLAI